ncbi:hypothetical protein PanWU01x14_187640 [Parasponia andersonii]|uniref:Transmembrane protein n=1 Tax=Parasponia andersonii TaxID=3476 RepID=A0A2P5C365_PARAD|nr:hypothetical protein PanWU01x14_187640 [Parasponia andersonii]
MAERDVGDGAAPAEDADASLAAPGEVRHALGDVGAVGDLHDVAPEGVRAVPGDEDGRLGLVLGAGRTAPRPARAHLDGAFPRLVAVLSLVLVVAAGVAHGDSQIWFLHGRRAR